MPRCKDSATTRNTPEDLMGRIRRHMPYRHQLMYEWPYIAGSTCLVVLLVWQPLQPSGLAGMLSQPQPGAHAAPRSLQEIDSNCYQVRSEMLSGPSCESCDNDSVSAMPDPAFQFTRSILTCMNARGETLDDRSGDRPQNMMIEVIRTNHSF